MLKPLVSSALAEFGTATAGRVLMSFLVRIP